MKHAFVFALLICLASLDAYAGDPPPVASDAASAPGKHKWIKKLKNHKAASSAVNPEASPDKKGGQ